MVHDDALDDRVVCFSLHEGQFQLVASQCTRDLTALKVQPVLLDINFDVLFVCSITTASLLNHIEVLSHHSAADLYVEDSFSWVAEVHLNSGGHTSANLRIRVTFPGFTRRE